MGKIISAQGMTLAEMEASKTKVSLLLEKSEMLEEALRKEIAKRIQFKSFLAFAVRKLGSLEIRKADMLDNVRFDVNLATTKDANGELVLTFTATEERIEGARLSSENEEEQLAGESTSEGEPGVSGSPEESSKT